MAKKRYYGIYADNGLGVYSDWDRVLNSRPFIRGERVKGFSYRNEAEMFAVDGFEDLHGPGSAMRTMIDGSNFSLNFFYHVR